MGGLDREGREGLAAKNANAKGAKARRREGAKA
jgi:hypothetical protein